MRNGLPFSKPRVRLYGETGDAQQYLGAAYNLLYKVRQFCEKSGTPVFSMQHTLPNGAVVQAAVFGTEEIVSCYPPSGEGKQEKRRPRKRDIANFYFLPQYTTEPEEAAGNLVQRWSDYTYTKPTKFSYDREIPVGSKTWWSDQVMYRSMPLVISWGLGNRYSSVANARGYYTSDPLGPRPWTWVWFNGAPVRILGLDEHDDWSTDVVYSAGIRLENDYLYLYVCGQEKVYRSAPLEQVGQYVRGDLDFVSVTPMFNHPMPLTEFYQMPVFDMACSKLFVAYRPNNPLFYEVNVASGFATSLSVANYTESTTTGLDSGQGETEYEVDPGFGTTLFTSITFTRNTAQTTIRTIEQPLAFDYDRTGALLRVSLLVHEDTTTTLARSGSGTAETPGSEMYGSLTEANNISISTTATITHSVRGQLLQVFMSESSTFTTSNSGYYDGGEFYGDQTGGGGTNVSVHSPRALVHGDLRNGTFWTNCSGAVRSSIASTTISAGGSDTTTTTYADAHETALFVKNAKITELTYGGGSANITSAFFPAEGTHYYGFVTGFVDEGAWTFSTPTGPVNSEEGRAKNSPLAAPSVASSHTGSEAYVDPLGLVKYFRVRGSNYPVDAPYVRDDLAFSYPVFVGITDEVDLPDEVYYEDLNGVPQ